MPPLALISRLLGDVRSIDELVYRGIIDLQLHMHRQSLLFTEVARALLPGGAGVQSTLLLVLAVRVAASLFSMVMSAFDEHFELERGGKADSKADASRISRRRASASAHRLFRVGMALLEDDDLDAEPDDEGDPLDELLD
jgi:hypothetical protein